MGIPKTHSASADPDPEQPTAATTSTPSPANLPPAALDLAAKLFDLARAGDTATLTQYIDAGIPANLTNHTGDTLLMLAAYHGHADTVQALLDAGADADALNARGQSPLAGAVFKGHDGVVRALFAAGASTAAGRPSAVETARMFRRADVCELFGVPIGGGAGEEMPPGVIPGAPATG